MTRRLLVALALTPLLALCSVVLLDAGPALAACPAAGGSTRTEVKRAADVLTGTVVDRRRDGNRVVYDVEVNRVYKGGLGEARVHVSTATSAKRCGVPDLRTRGRYVFFVRPDGAALTTDGLSGTARATPTLVRAVQRLLGEGRPATPPTPEKATLTVVGDGPMSLERVAAPGAALVLVGLLGLVVARRLGRRRA